MSKRGEEENVLAEEDVIQRGCEAVLKEMTFWGFNERQRMTGRVKSYNYESGFGTRSGQIMNASLTFCCTAFFWGGPCWLFVYGRFLIWQDSFFRAVCTSIRSKRLHPSSFSHMQPRFSFSSGVWVPERKSSLEIVLILLDTLLENLFAQRPRVCWI